MTIQDYIKFFQAIPDYKWITGMREDAFGRKCAVGHLGGWMSRESLKLGELFYGYIQECQTLCKHSEDKALIVAEVNDGLTLGVEGSTPKERILNVCHSIAKQLNSKTPDTNERTYITYKGRSNSVQVGRNNHSYVYES